MTNREQEILNIIKENPMISQQNLADKVGISRSSVAVHISNLISKGAILGKGYVVSEDSYIVVIGGANIDICGKPTNSIVKQDSNPGVVSISAGGVGRNIAQNLSLLNQNVKFFTAFGGDTNAEMIKSSFNKAKIDFHDSLTIKNESTSSYLFITDEKGEMQLAISDMEIYKYMTKKFIAGKLDIINNAILCIFDTNLPQETIEFIAEKVSVPIFVDPVSTAKMKKLLNIFDKIHTMKPNKLETELLTDVKISDEKTLDYAASKLIEKGIKNVYVSLGKNGVYFKSKNEAFHLPCLKTDIVNTTGAGDTFIASIAYAFSSGMNSLDSAKLGLAGSAICIESKDTINTELSEENILKRAGLIKKQA